MIKLKNVEFCIKCKDHPDYDITWLPRYCVNYPIEIPREIYESQITNGNSPVAIFLLGWFYRNLKDNDIFKDFKDIEKVRVRRWNIDD